LPGQTGANEFTGVNIYELVAGMALVTPSSQDYKDFTIT